MDASLKVGIIGCGNIFDQYIQGCRLFDVLNVIACADLDMDRARQRATEYSLQALSVDDLLAHPDIQVVVNLTIPAAHKAVSLAAIAAGKHVYSEKPLAITTQDGREILDAAAARGLRVGCAPDTFLGGALQTCIKLIDDGAIGTPVAATAFFANHGPESWHPNPDFFYKVGGGPVLDMAPYYLTALVTMLGSVRSVAGASRASFAQRTATSAARMGHTFNVEVPTLATAALVFETGAIGSVTFSFDIWAHQHPFIEIHGSEGSLYVPDPNHFGGRVQLYSGTDATRTWTDMPLTHHDKVGRGIGVADMVQGIISGRPHRASGTLAYHVLDVMEKLSGLGESGSVQAIESRVERPAPLPLGLELGRLDA